MYADPGQTTSRVRTPTPAKPPGGDKTSYAARPYAGKGTGEIAWSVLTVAIAGNRLDVHGSDGQGAGFRGEIILSDELPGSGRGYYYREDDADAYGLRWQLAPVDQCAGMSPDHVRPALAGADESAVVCQSLPARIRNRLDAIAWDHRLREGA